MFNLDFEFPKTKTKIIAAMSGGVDSSTVAAIFKAKGYQVIGITLELFDNQNVNDAKEVARKLGIEHYVLDYKTKFKELIIEYFVDTYASGETPSPCIKCNQFIKFHALSQSAKDLNVEALATGHYVRKINGANGPELYAALDASRDQSYFLFAITKEQLRNAYFPLGNYKKEQTRKLAAEFGLHIAAKPDSQDVCFISSGDYRDVINELRPGINKEGKILHIDGFELGKHNGITNYTIGQRRKVGVSFNEPLYVTKIDSVNNIVYVGPESAVVSTSFFIKDLNWLIDNKDFNIETEEVAVKIRSTHSKTPAKIIKLKDSNKIQVKLLYPEKAITPGQACVIYHNNRVLGGGWIMNPVK